MRLWKPACPLDILTRENGYFFVRFGSGEECQRILQTGPWLFDGRLIILKQWTQFIGLERYLLSSIPICVCFPSLHLKFWFKTIINKIASVIGFPLFMHKATSSFENLAFARCFVEISARQAIVNTWILEVEGGEKVTIAVEYEWVRPTCTRCKCFGHVDTQCPTKVEWRPKNPNVTTTKVEWRPKNPNVTNCISAASDTNNSISDPNVSQVMVFNQNRIMERCIMHMI